MTRESAVERICHAALELEGSARDAFVAAACAADDALRLEVESLLEHTKAGRGFLSAPAHLAAPIAGMSDPLLGRHAGPYLIQDVVGAGGMGVVYRALDTRLQRRVAVKVLADAAAGDGSHRRFQQEAEAASSLNHPHILTVHDAGTIDGRQYLVTELIEGGTLRTWVQAKPRTWREIIDLVFGVADGLAAAHDAGIVHRDVKPDNVLVARNGYAKLSDFGLAKLAAGGSRASDRDVITRAGIVMGTLGYMSPEQADGRRVDARSDIFSFGVMLREILASRSPAPDIASTMALDGVTPHPLPGPDVPPVVQAIIEKAIAPDPAARYQSMRDLVGDLRRVSHDAEVEPMVPAGPTRVRVRSWRYAAVALGVVGVIAALAAWRWPTGSPPGPIRSIAVLPLENLSRDPNQDYFSDGTTDALISSLAQIQALQVISRSSSMRYKGTTKTVPEIAAELGVDAIVEGSVQRVGDRVRVSARLIRGSTDTNVWARDYDREAADILRLEADVAQAIAREIRIHVTPEETGRLAAARRIEPEAHDAYLLAMHHLRKGSEPELVLAVSYLQQAIRLQPDYAAAYAALPHLWYVLAAFGREVNREEWRAAGMKAVALDPNLAQSHVFLGTLRYADLDYAGAEQEYLRALELDSASPRAIQSYSDLLSMLGRFDEAIAVAQRGIKIDPLSADAYFYHGLALYMAGRIEQALAPFRQSIQLESGHYRSLMMLGHSYQLLGKPEQALPIFERPEFQGSAYLAHTYLLLGRRTAAQQIVTALIERGGGPDLQAVALFYFASGEMDRGFAWLTKAFAALEQSSGLRYVSLARVNPNFDARVRADPRFDALIARLKLPR